MIPFTVDQMTPSRIRLLHRRSYDRPSRVRRLRPGLDDPVMDQMIPSKIRKSCPGLNYSAQDQMISSRAQQPSQGLDDAVQDMDNAVVGDQAPQDGGLAVAGLDRVAVHYDGGLQHAFQAVRTAARTFKLNQNKSKLYFKPKYCTVCQIFQPSI